MDLTTFYLPIHQPMNIWASSHFLTIMTVAAMNTCVVFVWTHIYILLVTPMGRGKQEKCETHAASFAMSDKILWLCPRSPTSFARIFESMVNWLLAY